MMAAGRGCCELPDCGVPAEDQDAGICVSEFERAFAMGQSKVSSLTTCASSRRPGWCARSGAAGGASPLLPGRRRAPLWRDGRSARLDYAPWEGIGERPDLRSRVGGGLNGGDEDEGLVRLHPQLGPLADGRRNPSAPGRGPFRGAQRRTEATHLRPEAISVTWELGVDISGQESETLERYLGEPFEYVVTVCDDANEACPIFPGAKERLQWSFEDPSRAEEEGGTARDVPAGKRRDPRPCRETSERESVNLREH